MIPFVAWPTCGLLYSSFPLTKIRQDQNDPEIPHHKALHPVLLWYCECCTLKAIHQYRDNDSVEQTDLGLSLGLTLVPQDPTQ